jgi:hypothetical protein
MPSRPSVVAPPPDSTEAEPSKILFTFFSFARLLKIFSIKEKSILLGGERMRAAAGRERTISFRATTRGARGQSGFSAKKVRISSKQYRKFTISAFWEEIASRLRRSAGALRAPKPHFATDCHAPRGEKETAWFWIWKFVLAKPKAKQSFANQSFFVSPTAKHGSDNFNILTASL